LLKTKEYYKEEKMKIVAILLVILLALAGCGTSGGTNGTTTEGTTTETTRTIFLQTFSIGTQANADGVNYSVTAVKESEGSGDIKPAEGNIFYIVDVTVMNRTTETITISLDQFKLVDFSGTAQNAAANVAITNTVAGDVAGNDTTLIGQFAYEISKEAKGLKLEIIPFLDDPTNVIVFNLDR
jgi:hypothetical protein